MTEDSVTLTSKPGHSPSPRGTGLLELFLLFSHLGLSSFGGNVSAWIHRAFVEQRRAIGETEFIAALALARIMPGATVINLAVVIGRRLHGAAGAGAAVLGLLLAPSLAVIVFAILYQRFADIAAVRTVLEGAAAASVGLMISMGISTGRHVLGVGRRWRRPAAHELGALAVIAATFVLIGVLRVAMVPAVLCLVPLSIAFAYFVPPAPRPQERSDGGG
jgi:chromate transporter